MNPTQIVRGTLKPDGTLDLAERLHLVPGAVRITVESMVEPTLPRLGLISVMGQIRADQAARGYRGRSLQEMRSDEANKHAEEQAYEERWRNIHAQSEASPRGDR